MSQVLDMVAAWTENTEKRTGVRQQIQCPRVCLFAWVSFCFSPGSARTLLLSRECHPWPVSTMQTILSEIRWQLCCRSFMWQVLSEYRRRGMDFVMQVINEPTYLEDLTGLTDLMKSAACSQVEWVETDEDDFVEIWYMVLTTVNIISPTIWFSWADEITLWDAFTLNNAKQSSSHPVNTSNITLVQWWLQV